MDVDQSVLQDSVTLGRKCQNNHSHENVKLLTICCGVRWWCLTAQQQFLHLTTNHHSAPVQKMNKCLTQARGLVWGIIKFPVQEIKQIGLRLRHRHLLWSNHILFYDICPADMAPGSLGSLKLECEGCCTYKSCLTYHNRSGGSNTWEVPLKRKEKWTLQ